jgi:hypothetical protein
MIAYIEILYVLLISIEEQWDAIRSEAAKISSLIDPLIDLADGFVRDAQKEKGKVLKENVAVASSSVARSLKSHSGESFVANGTVVTLLSQATSVYIHCLILLYPFLVCQLIEMQNIIKRTNEESIALMSVLLSQVSEANSPFVLQQRLNDVISSLERYQVPLNVLVGIVMSRFGDILTRATRCQAWLIEGNAILISGASNHNSAGLDRNSAGSAGSGGIRSVPVGAFFMTSSPSSVGSTTPAATSGVPNPTLTGVQTSIPLLPVAEIVLYKTAMKLALDANVAEWLGHLSKLVYMYSYVLISCIIYFENIGRSSYMILLTNFWELCGILCVQAVLIVQVKIILRTLTEIPCSAICHYFVLKVIVVWENYGISGRFLR